MQQFGGPGLRMIVLLGSGALTPAVSTTHHPPTVRATAAAWGSASVEDSGTTPNATATFAFNGTDSTGVRFTCTLTARCA